MQSQSSEKLKILVVDDELSARYSARFTLETFAEVDTAGSTEEALELLEKKKYDVILLDLFIKTEEQGLYALETIHRKYPDTPIIIMSGSVKWMQNWAPLRMKGARAYMTKPFSCNTAKEFIDRVLSGEYIDPTYL